MSVEYTVEGRTKKPAGGALEGLLVRAFSKTLPSLGTSGERQLGPDAITNSKGRYEIAFTAKEFESDENLQGRAPDLFIRVYDGDTLLGESEVLFNAPARARIDLVVETPERSEYESVVHRIKPALHGIAIADLTDDDLTFLQKDSEAGEKRSRLFGVFQHEKQNEFAVQLLALRQSALNARQTNLPPEAFYGWARVLGAQLTSDDLARCSDDELRHALEKAVAEKIVPASFRDQADAIVRSFRRVGFVPYPATLQLLDQSLGTPLPGFKVLVVDPASQAKTGYLASLVTDGRGMATFTYFAQQVEKGGPATLDFPLKISDPGGTSLPDVTLQLRGGHTEVVRISVGVPAVEEPPSPTLADLSATLVVIPESLRTFFQKRNIRTLSDIRNMGGLRHVPGLPVADDSAVRLLEALADLSRVSADVRTSAHLIDKGFNSVAEIADTPRSTFVAAVSGETGDFNAAQMHVMAKAQTAFLDSVLAGMAGGRSDATRADGTFDGPLAGFPQRCACEDCESAISPAMYLADLLRFAVSSIQVNGGNINLQFLVDNFYQPFDALPISCEAVNQKVLRARICIEVLRAYLGPRPLANPAKEAALAKVDRDYLFQAYTNLLNRIGTSFDEIRLARTDTDDNREALADRLGIELTRPRPAGGDELDRLYIDTSTGANGPNGLERMVEWLFGLADTFRDPLSDGAKFGDDNNAQIRRWSLRGAEWGRNTDPDGNVYVSFENPDPNSFDIRIYRDPQRTQLVASSDRATSGHVPILPENAGDLSGTFDVPVSPLPVPSSSISISAVPNFLSWRLKHLRTVWAEQDRPDDAYSDSATPKLPLIDPDLIGPDDFRSPVLTGAGAPFDLWLARRGLVDKTLSDLRATREGPGGLTAALERVFGKPLPNLDQLLQKLTSGDNDQVKTARDAIAALNLTPDSFMRLMQVRGEDQQAQIDPRIQVSDDEWADVYSILAQAVKVKLFDPWRTQETQLKLLLGFQDFWVSLREPPESVWPPAELDNTPQSTPLIDPQIQTLKDLPEPIAGQQGIALWSRRVADLQAFSASLAATRQSAGFQAMLLIALGDPLPHDLDQLRKDLASSNPGVVSAAQTAITKDLHLTLEGFTTLMNVRDKDAQPDPLQKPTTAEYAEVFAILTKAWKIGKAFPKWIGEEKATFAAEGQAAGDPLIAYWRARKAALPRWRASSEARQLWQQALLARCAPPVLDPDLVGPENLRDPFAGNAAYDLWTGRTADLTGRLSAISQTQRTNANLNSLFVQYLGVTGSDLAAIDADRANGRGIRPRLNQLGLTNGAFSALVRVWTLSTNNQVLVDSDWETVGAILIQSYKLRRFGAWRSEEASRQPAVILGSDLFQVPPPPPDPLSAATPRQLPAWRASRQALRSWTDTLQSRIDEQNTVIAGMRDAVTETETATLEPLRDGLILATQASGSDLDRAATWVTKRFLIDAKAGTCQTTTRVEQAIETVQGLFVVLASEPFDLGVFEFGGGLAAVGAAGAIHVFARGSDDALWHTQQVGNTWLEWESLGGELSTDPCVCARNGNLEVFALLGDSAVWQKTFANGVWSDWQSLGGDWTSAPAAVSWGGDHLEVVVRGSDWAPWHRRFENGQWANWESLSLGGAIISSSLAVSSRGLRKLDVVARGMDNGAWYLAFDIGWKTWMPRGGLLNSAPAVASLTVTSPETGQTSVFVVVLGRGTDDALYANIFLDPAVPSGWAGIFPGVLPTAPPAAWNPSPDRLDVLVRGDDNRGWHGFLEELPTPSWSGWSPIGPAPLTLNAADFETDWKWLGSYAKWRAAMLVFLYPENLLQPTLRPQSWQTPAFIALAGALSTAGTLTPDGACRIADAYESYFRDVCNLTVEATCHSLLSVPGPSGCNVPALPETHESFFMFARGGATNKLYWSVVDLELAQAGSTRDYAQRPWTEIKAGAIGDAIQLVGAVPFERYVYLFVHTKELGEERLVALKFDWLVPDFDLGWSVAVPDLKPSGVSSFTATVRQDQKLLGFNADLPGVPDSPPAVGIQATDGSIFYDRLNATGTAWTDGGPRRQLGNYPEMLSIIRRGSLPSRTSDAILITLGVDPQDPANPGWVVQFLPASGVVYFWMNTVYHGTAWLSFRRDMALNNDKSGLAIFILADYLDSPSVFTPYGVDGRRDATVGIQQIGNIIPSAGNPRTLAKPAYQFVYDRRFGKGNSSDFRRCTFDWADNNLVMATEDPLAPDVDQDMQNIPRELTASELQLRRRRIELTFLTNLLSPQSLLLYLEEAYYFVPIQLGLQSQQSGEYESALGWFRTVYDYTAPRGDERKIYYGLKAEESIPQSYLRGSNWLSDPLNPHAVALTRGNTYTRFTLVCIVRCLLDFADSEFSQDTGESLARARTLYQTALDLLDTDELKPPLGDCPSIIGALNLSGPSSALSEAQLAELKRRLSRVKDRDRLQAAVSQIAGHLKSGGSAEQHLPDARRAAARSEALAERPTPLHDIMTSADLWRKQQYASLTAKRDIQRALQAVGEAAGAGFARAVAGIAHVSPEKLTEKTTDLSWLQNPARISTIAGATESSPESPQRLLAASREFRAGYVPSAASLWGCVPPYPALDTLRLHAELNLNKLRSCRNIAGMKRELEPYSAPTGVTTALPTIGPGSPVGTGNGVPGVQPTLYRYSTIIERARQLTQVAIQMEGEMLSALEKRDESAYTLFRARQDIGVAEATAALNRLKVNEARDRVSLARLQVSQVDDQIAYYQELLQNPTSENEQGALVDLDIASDLQSQAEPSAASGIGSVISGGVSGAASGASAGTMIAPGIGTVIGGVAGFLLGGALAASSSAAASDLAQAGSLATAGSASLLRASFERRAREWQYQLTLANDNAVIGGQQITIANDDVGIAAQEQSIADLQTTNARDVVEFLTSQFTNPDLFSFMSEVLGRVYSFFLRQATGIANLAENQLAFERQEPGLGVIQSDYWAPPTDIQSNPSGGPADRKGLTGAERLLADITQLDQYAFLADKRKLQLSKTFSLARLAPAEFQLFRETGVMTFATPMELFDRDFPGHYLRLVRVVSASVIALIPPNQGIAATLSCGGLSRVVVGGDTFQTLPIRRDPESIALCTAMGTSGVFNLSAQSTSMLLPFENIGVDTTWEFRMEKASNLFDYSTIADVVFNLDFTALNSDVCRAQVIQSLNPELITDRPFSFRNQLADQWYDLHNPDQTPNPMTVRFTTSRDDFPPNLDDLKIRQIVLYFSRAEGESFEVPVQSFRFLEQGSAGAVGGGATSIDGTISTRRGNAGSWIPIIGRAPFGEWELALPDNDETRGHFTLDDIKEMLFVITYSGRTAQWQK